MEHSSNKKLTGWELCLILSRVTKPSASPVLTGSGCESALCPVYLWGMDHLPVIIW